MYNEEFCYVYNEGFRKVNKELHNLCNEEFQNMYNEGFLKVNNELHNVY